MIARVRGWVRAGIEYEVRDWRDAGVEHYRFIKALVIGGVMYKAALLVGIF